MIQWVSDFLVLSDKKDIHPLIPNWRISSLRMFLLPGMVASLAIILHGGFISLFSDQYFGVVLSTLFFLMMLVLLRFSQSYYRLCSLGFLLIVMAGGFCLNACVTDPGVAQYGAIYVYSLPVVALVLLGYRAALWGAVFNLIPLYMLINQVHLVDWTGRTRDLPYIEYYIHGFLYVFFNLSLSFSVARSIKAAYVIKQQKNALNEALSSKDQLFKTLFVSSPTAYILISENGDVIDVNQAARKLLACQDDSSEHSLERCFPGMKMNQVYRKRIDRVNRYFLFSESNPMAQNKLLEVKDVTSTVNLENEIQRKHRENAALKNTDAETGLPNRMWLKNEMSVLLNKRDTLFVLVMVRLSNASYLEKKLGSDNFIQLLRHVAEEVRPHSWSQKTVAHVYFDTVSTLLTVEDENLIGERLESIRSRLSNIHLSPEQSVSLNIKMGVARARDASISSQELMSCALSALDNGHHSINHYEVIDESKALERQEIAALLREAIERDELFLVFQPIVDRNQDIQCFEALLRWQSPELGFVPPDQFIPISEEFNLIEEVTEWVIEHVCRQINQWRCDCNTLYPVCINISALDLDNDRFHIQLSDMLKKHRVSPQLIVLELTESVLSEQEENTVKMTDQLHQLGFSIALDDFGTGYSGLSRLVQYPIRRLKIDKQFIDGIENDPSKRTIVRSVVAMANVMKVSVTAEGVETRAQYELVRQLGCDLFQGFGFSKPQKAQVVSEWLMSDSQHLNI